MFGADAGNTATATADGPGTTPVAGSTFDVGEGWATPVVIGGALLLPAPPDEGTNGGLRVIDRRSAGPRWTYVESPVGCPAVVGDSVYVAAGETVVALGHERGEVRWTTDAPEATTRPLTVAGDTVLVPDSDGVTAFETDSGSRRWRRTDLAIFDDGLVGVPTVAGGNAFLAGEGVAAVDLETGEEQWAWESFIRDSSKGPNEIATDGDRVYVAARQRLVALDVGDGTVVWEAVPESVIYSNRLSAPALADGTIVVGSWFRDEAGPFLVGLDPETGERRWRVNRAVRTAPTVADGTAYGIPGGSATGVDSLVVVDVDSGRELYAGTPEGHEPNPGALGRPAVAGGRLYVREGNRVVTFLAQALRTAEERVERLRSDLETLSVPEAEEALAEARERIDNGDYAEAAGLAEQGLETFERAERAEDAISAAESGGLPDRLVAPVSDAQGRADLLRRAEAAYDAGEYERARRLAERAKRIEDRAYLELGGAAVVATGLAASGGAIVRRRRAEKRDRERRKSDLGDRIADAEATAERRLSDPTVTDAILDEARTALADEEFDRVEGLVNRAYRATNIDGTLDQIEQATAALREVDAAPTGVFDPESDLEQVLRVTEQGRDAIARRDLGAANRHRDTALERLATRCEDIISWGRETADWLEALPERLDAVADRPTDPTPEAVRQRVDDATAGLPSLHDGGDDHPKPVADIGEDVATLVTDLAEWRVTAAERAVGAVAERTEAADLPDESLARERVADARRAVTDNRDPERAVSRAAAVEELLNAERNIAAAESTLALLREHASMGEPSVRGVETRLESAREALADGGVGTATEWAERARRRAESELQELAETAVERLEPVRGAADAAEGLDDLIDEARAALDAGDAREALQRAADAHERALEALPTAASDHETAAATALDDDDYATAATKFRTAAAIYERLTPIAEVVGEPGMAENIAAAADTAEQRAESVADEAAASVTEHTDRAETALERAGAAVERGAPRDAAEAYATAAAAFEEAQEAATEAPSLSDADPEAYARRAAEAREGLHDLAERTVEEGFGALPPEELVAAEEARGDLQAAADALAEQPERAVDLAVGGRETAREAVRSYADERLVTGREALSDDRFREALEALEAARAGYAHLRETLPEDEATAVDSVLGTVDEAVAAVRERASERVEALTERAAERADEADSAFRDGDHEDARAKYAEARERYAAAADLAADLAVGEPERYREAVDRMAERVEYARLATHADRVEAARERIAEEPAAAAEAFREVAADLRSLDPGSELASDRDELVAEAERGVLHARVESARETMREAERLFDQGDGYAARDRYGEALDALTAVADEADDPEAIPLLPSLRERCETNVERVKESLTGIARIRDDEGLLRVGAPGEPLPDTADKDPDDASTSGETPPAGPDTDTPGDPVRDAAVAPGVSVGSAVVEDRLGRKPPAHERLERLGAGGNAEVWLVALESGEPARGALKRPRSGGTLHRSDAERFLREAATWHRVDDHPNVVTVHDWGFAAEPWLLMAYAPDGDLSSLVGEVSPVRAAGLLADVAAALAHARGVDHLDVKPANVLLDDDRAMLADWGLARTAFGDDAHGGHTPGYAAPEQFDRERGPVDARTDIYQLGVTAYELLTGELPYDPSAPDHAEQVCAGEAPPPSARTPAVPAALDEVVMRAMAVDRTDRYEAPIQLRDDLRAVAAEEGDAGGGPGDTDDRGDSA